MRGGGRDGDAEGPASRPGSKYGPRSSPCAEATEAATTAVARTAALRARARALEADDRRFLWHPFTQMRDWLAEHHLIIERAEGSYLIDVEGRRYLDGVSSLWVTLHGHRRPEIDRAIVSQLERVAHSTMLGLSHVPAIELARRLVEIAPPGLTRVFYSDAGSTAVEIALKIAFQFRRQGPAPGRGRTRFLRLANAYHGDTIGSVSVGGIDLFHDLYRPLLFDSISIPSPYCYRCPMGLTHPSCKLGCLIPLEEVLESHDREIGAMIVEPVVQGAAGMIVQPPGYLKEVRRLTARHGVLLIADEVATGFGRTGRMFACELESIEPDILCLAKGLSGGYLPLAATLTTERIFRGFLAPYSAKKTFFHGHSYTGNPLACVASLASLEIFRREKVIEGLAAKEKAIERGLAPLASLAHVGEVRRRGLMVGIELVRNRRSRAEYPHGGKMGHRVILEARRRGVILRPLGNVVVLMPPLSIAPDEIALLCSVTEESIRAVTEAGRTRSKPGRPCPRSKGAG